MTRLWTRRSMVTFFAIGFGIPWLGWTTLALTGLQRPSPLATALFYTGDFMTVGGLVAVWVAGGGPGLRAMLRRTVEIRAPAVWALFALFLPLGLAIATRLVYGATHGGVGRFDPSGFATYAAPGVLLALTTGPLGEEAGWRGYLLPRLLGRFGPLRASLLLGAIWSVWHYPLYVESVFATAGGAFRFTASVLCFSVLLTLLWAHTGGSVFWAVVLHWTVNISGQVADAILPDVRAPQGATDWLSLGLLVIVTAVAFAAVRPARLRRRLDEVTSALAAEAIDTDRGSA